MPLMRALYVILHAHTVGRARAAYKVATFPLVTDRAGDPKFWAACFRLARQGFFSLDPLALQTLVQTRAQVERVAEAEAFERLRRAQAAKAATPSKRGDN